MDMRLSVNDKGDDEHNVPKCVSRDIVWHKAPVKKKTTSTGFGTVEGLWPNIISSLKVHKFWFPVGPRGYNNIPTKLGTKEDSQSQNFKEKQRQRISRYTDKHFYSYSWDLSFERQTWDSPVLYRPANWQTNILTCDWFLVWCRSDAFGSDNSMEYIG